MYRKILVPVDGSNTSRLGLDEAFRLAQSECAQIRLVHVVDESAIPAATPVPFGRITDFASALKSAGAKILRQAAAAAAKKRVQADCVQPMSAGRRVSEVILDEARTWHADVIVMGTHGRQGLNRLLLGSDAQRVLREATVPILFVKSGDRKTSGPGRSAA